MREAHSSLAVSELRSRSGVQALALVGLKLGATLAALAAEDLGDVDALVLWGAHESGKAYVSEATKAHRMHTMLEPASFSGGRNLLSSVGSNPTNFR